MARRSLWLSTTRFSRRGGGQKLLAILLVVCTACVAAAVSMPEKSAPSKVVPASKPSVASYGSPAAGMGIVETLSPQEWEALTGTGYGRKEEVLGRQGGGVKRVRDLLSRKEGANGVSAMDLTERGAASQTTKQSGKRNSNNAASAGTRSGGSILSSADGDTSTAAVDTMAVEPSDSDTYATVPPPGYDLRRLPLQSPVYVNIAFELKRLYGIDENRGTCSYSIFVMTMWADTRLAYDKKKLRKGEQYINLSPSDVWHPVVEPQGATVVRKTKEVVRLMPSGDVMMIQKMQVDASSMFDLSWFPFDQQRIPLEFVLYTYTVDQVVLQLNDDWSPWFTEKKESFVQGATASINVHAKPSWNIYGFGGDVVEFTVEGEDQKWSKAAVYLDVKRRYFYYALAYFVPLVFITLTGNTAFYIDPQDNGSRIGVAMGAVLALVAMEYVLLSELPKAGYVMWIHIYIIGQFLMVCTPTFFSFITSHLNNDKHYSRKTDIQKLKPEEKKSTRTWVVVACMLFLPTGYSSDIVKKVDNIGLVISLTIFVVFNCVMFLVAGIHAYT